jgi:hypothetical protein
MLKSVEDIVDALGGTVAVATLAAVGPSTVSNWKARGGIPPENFMKLSAALERRRLQADPALFGFK